jgi:hypothetical protein
MSNTGHCLCGSVSYSISTDPALVGVCHCEDCQRFTGSAFSYLVGVLETDLQIQGELETFSKPGDSGILSEVRVIDFRNSGNSPRARFTERRHAR